MLVSQILEECLHVNLGCVCRAILCTRSGALLFLCTLSLLCLLFLGLLFLLLCLLLLFVIVSAFLRLWRCLWSSCAVICLFQAEVLGVSFFICLVLAVDVFVSFLFSDLLKHDFAAYLCKALLPALAAHLNRAHAWLQFCGIVFQPRPTEDILPIEKLDTIALEGLLASLLEKVCVLPGFQPAALGLFFSKLLIKVEHHGSAGVTLVPFRHVVAVLVLLRHGRSFNLHRLNCSTF
mmetsp:Transcript_20204/g.35997  ORF Transcript_20204/g.35997 Transcript_20204/m.35997 type:complete len:235 (+) Transcript_20204:186-890(+)